MLHIIRGLPGSGKSTLANAMLANGVADLHYEADMFFMVDGEYKFNPDNLKDAHAWCQSMTFNALKAGKKVVVSNTFVKHWEYKPYVDFCLENDIVFEIKICENEYGSIHNVPAEAISRMRSNFER